MREVDFRCLQSAIESLGSSTDLVLANGWVKVTLSRQCSPDVSQRGVAYEQIAPVAPEGVIVATNYRYVVAISDYETAVEEATERGPHPFDDELGWNGPRAGWVVECVPTTILRPILETARTYGLVGREWMEAPLLHVAWLVPYDVRWDENGRPVFDWPVQSTESERDQIAR